MKKLLVVVLMLCMMFCFVGCEDSLEDKQTNCPHNNILEATCYRPKMCYDCKKVLDEGLKYHEYDHDTGKCCGIGCSAVDPNFWTMNMGDIFSKTPSISYGTYGSGEKMYANIIFDYIGNEKIKEINCIFKVYDMNGNQIGDDIESGVVFLNNKYYEQGEFSYNFDLDGLVYNTDIHSIVLESLFLEFNSGARGTVDCGLRTTFQ